MLGCPVGYVASYWSYPHNLTHYWSGSQSLKEIVLSQFPSPVIVKLKNEKFSDLRKLDGVGPVNNRPSTDKLHHFVQKKKNVTRNM